VEQIESVYQDLIDNLIFLPNHMKGLCVVKKVIQLTTNKNFKTKIRDIITENELSLVHNSYEYYAIQTALEVN